MPTAVAKPANVDLSKRPLQGLSLWASWSTRAVIAASSLLQSQRLPSCDSLITITCSPSSSGGCQVCQPFAIVLRNDRNSLLF